MNGVRVTDRSQTYRLQGEMAAAGLRHGQVAVAELHGIQVVDSGVGPEVRFCNMGPLQNVQLIPGFQGDEQPIPDLVTLNMGVTQPGFYNARAVLSSNGTIGVTVIGTPEPVAYQRHVGDVIGG